MHIGERTFGVLCVSDASACNVWLAFAAAGSFSEPNMTRRALKMDEEAAKKHSRLILLTDEPL